MQIIPLGNSGGARGRVLQVAHLVLKIFVPLEPRYLGAGILRAGDGDAGDLSGRGITDGAPAETP
jgi:hypothetical protein